ncbi:hypothetical protein KY487_11950, partial [Ralstonia pseudosolanacearum]|uniref:hypothetical protein n=1 Tax=Ralstonia pseudosolanacearum TaxID=1310165 RepID=UPI001C8C6FF7
MRFLWIPPEKACQPRIDALVFAPRCTKLCCKAGVEMIVGTGLDEQCLPKKRNFSKSLINRRKFFRIS